MISISTSGFLDTGTGDWHVLYQHVLFIDTGTLLARRKEYSGMIDVDNLSNNGINIHWTVRLQKYFENIINHQSTSFGVVQRNTIIKTHDWLEDYGVQIF